MKQSLKAIILAGGFGTRLRPLSCTRPKILFPILNEPLLEWTYVRLSNNGIDEAILAVDYETEVAIKQNRIPRHGINVTYSRDPIRRPLGTGGPLRKAENLLNQAEPFLVLNGDVFTDVNYKQLLRTHEKHDATATIALHAVADPSRYGVAQLNKEYMITRFDEKPKKGKASGNLINAGAYVLDPKILKLIPKNKYVSLEREIFAKLAQQNELYGYVHKGLWRDIGKPEDYLELNWTLMEKSRGPVSKKRLAAQVEKPVVIDRNVSIGRESKIGPYAIVGKNVKIGKNVRIAKSIVFREVAISDFVSINGAIIGEGAYVGRNSQIGQGCIIGDHVRIKDNLSLARKVTVCPAKEISESILTEKNIF